VKIVIDARTLRTSTGRYIERLIHYLQKIDNKNDYVILLKPKDFDSWQPSNPRFKVSDERLNAIPKAERVALCNAFSECVEQLDNLSMPLWAFNAEAGGWKNVLDYLYSCMDNEN